MVSTFTNYALIAKDLSAALKRKAAEPQLARETAYFEANIGKVKSVDEFLANTRLYTYAMKAYGLEDMIFAKAFMRRVLNEGVADSSSFANRLTDNRYRDFAKAFNVAGGWGASATGEGIAYNAISPSFTDARPATATASRPLTEGQNGTGLFDFSTTNEVSFVLTTNLDSNTTRSGKIVLNAGTLANAVIDRARVTADEIVRVVNAQIDASALKGTVRAALDVDGRLVFATRDYVDLGADGRVGGTGRDADRTYAATAPDRAIQIQNTDRSSPFQTGISIGFGVDNNPDITALAGGRAPAQAIGSRVFAQDEVLDFSTTGEVSFELTTSLDAATARTVTIVLNAETLNDVTVNLARVTPAELLKAINGQIDASGHAGLKGAVAASFDTGGRLVFTTTDVIDLGADGEAGGTDANADRTYAGDAPQRTIRIHNTDRSAPTQTGISIGFGLRNDPDVTAQVGAAGPARVVGNRGFAAGTTLDFTDTSAINFDLTTHLDATTTRTGRIVIDAAALTGRVANLAAVTPAELLRAINDQIDATGDGGLKGTVEASFDASGHIVFATKDYVDLGADGQAGGTGRDADRAFAADGIERTIRVRTNDSGLWQVDAKTMNIGFGVGVAGEPDKTAVPSIVGPARATGSQDLVTVGTFDFSTTSEVSFDLATHLDATTVRTGRIVLNAATLKGQVADLAKVTSEELLKAVNAAVDASDLKGAVAASYNPQGRLVFTSTDLVDLGSDGKEGGTGAAADRTLYAGNAPERTILIRNTDRSSLLQSAFDIGFGIDDDPDTSVQARAATAGSAAEVSGARLFGSGDTLDFGTTGEVGFRLTTSLDADTVRSGTIVLNAAALKGSVANLAKVTPAELVRAINAQIDASGNANLQGAVRASLDAVGRLVFTTTDTVDLGADGRLGGTGVNADRAYGAVGAGRTVQVQNIDRSAATQTGLDIGFGVDNGPDATVRAATSAYLRQSLETDAGEEDTGVRLALYFARLGPTLTSGYQILGDTALTQVVNTVLGLRTLTGGGAEALASRARLIEQKIDLKSFADPKKLDAFVRRFAAVWDAQNDATASPLLALFGSSGAGIGANLLLSAVRVRTGG